MASFLISYDLDKPGQDYQALTDRLKKLGAVKVLLSEWIIVGSYACKDLRDDLKQYIDSNDKLLVVKLTGEAAWTQTMISDERLKQLLQG